jgi:hypothetical protein
VLPNMNKAIPSGQSYTLGVHTIRLRHTKCHRNIQSPRMMQTLWLKESMTEEVEDFEDAQHQRDQIQDELDNMRQLLEHIREMQREGRGIDSILARSEV